MLGIGKGDLYNPELLENRLRFSQDGRDISSYYLDDGYLGFNVDPVEIAVENDSVDLEMRIFEGPQFTIENVVIKGNDRNQRGHHQKGIEDPTRTKIQQVRHHKITAEIINLGYFNPEALRYPNARQPGKGTVDIEYSLEEKPSDQLELSAGYGGTAVLLAHWV